MNAIRKLWVAIMSVTILTTLPSGAKADSGICYMVTSSGQTISLGKLCGATQNDGVFRVPIKRRSGKTPVIDVTFNGNQVFEMILDTGASGTLITQQMAYDSSRTYEKLRGSCVADKICLVNRCW